MATIYLHRRQRSKYALPYWVYLDERPVGIMRTPELGIALPTGSYTVGVRLLFGVGRFSFAIGGERRVDVGDEPIHLTISDKERFWNMLFNLDLVVWIASFFVTLPHPWDIVYHVLSEGFFILWALRIWIIRRRYFTLTPAPPQPKTS